MSWLTRRNCTERSVSGVSINMVGMETMFCDSRVELLMNGRKGVDLEVFEDAIYPASEIFKYYDRWEVVK